MAKFRSIKNSLIAGEISPTAMGRTDLPQYLHACKTLRNMIPMLSGGAYRRPGSFFEFEISAEDEYVPGLIPFVVSKTEAYSLAFRRDAISSSVTAFRATSNNNTSTQTSVTGTHPYLPALFGTSSTVGNYDEIHDVQYIQSADVLYLVHPNRKPMRVTRSAIDTFTIAEFDSGLSGTGLRDAWPYRPQNATSTTITVTDSVGSAPIAAGTTVTLTASASFFNSGHVGALFKFNYSGSNIGCVKVTSYSSATSVTGTVVNTIDSEAATLLWWESAWSDYRGWPRSVALFRQRLCYGGNKAQPDTIWFSQGGDYNQMSMSTRVSPEAGDGATGSDPFQFTILSNELNQIQWLAARKTLVAGTLGEEHIIENGYSSTSTGFGADNISSTSNSSFGSCYLQTARLGTDIAFTLPSQDQIYLLSFNDSENNYDGEPVQILFDEYPKMEPPSAGANSNSRRFRRFAWDRGRGMLWCCDTAGNLFALTRDKKTGVVAWSTHQMGGYDEDQTGGYLGNGSTLTIDPAYYVCSGSVISAAVVPNPTIGTDDIWLVVKRKVDGVFKYHIERIIGKSPGYASVYESVSSGVGNYFVDAATFNTNEYPGPEDYSFSGLDHLEGVAPTGTGSNQYGLFTISGSEVSSGVTEIQTPYPSNFTSEPCVVTFGHGFNSIVEPVRLESGSVIGTAQGAIKRIHKAFIRFYRTMSAKVGRDADNLETLIFRTGSTPLQNSAELFTGDKEVLLDSDYDRDGYVHILQDKPLPFSVISIISEGHTYD